MKIVRPGEVLVPIFRKPAKSIPFGIYHPDFFVLKVFAPSSAVSRKGNPRPIGGPIRLAGSKRGGCDASRSCLLPIHEFNRANNALPANTGENKPVVERVLRRKVLDSQLEIGDLSCAATVDLDLEQ